MTEIRIMALTTEHTSLAEAIAHATEKKEQFQSSNLSKEESKPDSIENKSEKKSNGNGNGNKNGNKKRAKKDCIVSVQTILQIDAISKTKSVRSPEKRVTTTKTGQNSIIRTQTARLSPMNIRLVFKRIQVWPRNNKLLQYTHCSHIIIFNSEKSCILYPCWVRTRAENLRLCKRSQKSYVSEVMPPARKIAIL